MEGETAVGVGTARTWVPFPTCPEPFEPQQIAPDPVTAQVCDWPAAMELGFVTPPTWSGPDSGAVVPLPSWPRSFRPQQYSATAGMAPGGATPAARREGAGMPRPLTRGRAP